MDVKHHFVKEKVVMQSVEFNYIPSSENLADILMKPLAKEVMVYCCVKIGILSQMVTYLFCDGLEYRFKELISRVRQATKNVVKSEV